MRILVSGINGFVGRHLAEALLARGDRLWGFSADPVTPIGDAEVFQVDVLDREAMSRVVARAEPEVIIHLAGLSHIGQSWSRPGDYLRVNFEGSRNLLRAAGGRQVIFASSAEVYGCVPEDEQPIREDRPLDPRSPYAMTKACTERIALDRGAIVTRSFNAIGTGQSPNFALPSFAGQLAAIERGESEPVLRVGDLSPRRDFLHVADVAAGYLALIDHGDSGTVYNLAGGRALSIAEALDRLRRISGVDARVEPEASRMRPVDIPLLVGDAGRLAELGWKPERGVEQALGEIWREAKARASEGG